MDLDLSMLWSWTVPIWGIVALVFFLVGALIQPQSLSPIPGAIHRVSGGPGGPGGPGGSGGP